MISKEENLGHPATTVQRGVVPDISGGDLNANGYQPLEAPDGTTVKEEISEVGQNIKIFKVGVATQSCQILNRIVSSCS